MKKLCIVLAVCFLLALCACKPTIGPLSTPTPEPTPTPVPTPTPDPLDAVFAKKGEEIISIQKNGQEISLGNGEHPDYWLYNSHDLKVEITQKTAEKLVYYVAHIRMRADVREYALYGSETPPGNNMSKATQMARKAQAVLAINGDYLVKSHTDKKGTMVRSGVVYQESSKESTLAFMPDMSLAAYPAGVSGQTLLDAGVQNALSFGPLMVENGAKIEKMTDVRKINNVKNPRCGIGMVEPGHLVAIVIEGRIPRSGGITVPDFADLFLNEGCTLAYNLDGGRSTSMVFMGNLVNCGELAYNIYLGCRTMPDMIAFGTSDQCATIDDLYYMNGKGVNKNYVP